MVSQNLINELKQIFKKDYKKDWVLSRRFRPLK